MKSSGLDDIYREAILDHSRSPRNQDEIDDPDLTGRSVNPFCGDEIDLQVRLDEGERIVQIGVQSKGCAINQAAGSLLTEALIGKSLEEAVVLSDIFGAMMRGTEPSEQDLVALGDLQALAGIRRLPVRIKCALLAWSALDDGIEEYRDSAK